MKRRRMFQTFKAAGEVADYSEMPMLPMAVDPQVTLSRNTLPQPFYLVCAKDTMLAQLSGEAVVHLRHSTVSSFNLGPGDNVYVPAGTPHRIVPLTLSVQLRYKAQKPGLEGVAWFCEDCDLELCRAEWDTEETASHRAYHDACEAFNSSEGVRRCDRCAAEHPAVDLAPFCSWLDTAEAVEAERAAAREKAAAASAS